MDGDRGHVKGKAFMRSLPKAVPPLGSPKEKPVKRLRSSGMLDMRPNCECCDRDPSPGDEDVFICSFECTWCTECVGTFPAQSSPNCGCTLTRRPPRAPDKLISSPASEERVVKPGCLGVH